MLKLYINGEKIADEIGEANHFFSRFMGLMFKKSMNETQGLWIVPCNQVHSFNMRFDIDVVFLDKSNKVVYIEHSMKPRRVTKMIKGAYSVIELCSSVAEKNNIQLGDIITLE